MDRAPPPGPASASQFRVFVLGPFALYEGDKSLNPGTWPPRAQSLLKLVATAPDHRRPRDEIIDSLWPEATPEAGAANLRYTLHLLRRMLGSREPSPILFEKHLVALNPAHSWEVDLERLEELAGTAGDDSATLERAAQLYRGEPLVEDRYADWAVPVRERAQRIWRDLCLRLATQYRMHGAKQDAVRWYERALERDPLDEEAMLGIVEVLSAAHRPVDALRYYRRFAATLEAELDVPPGPALMAAADQLVQSVGPQPPAERQPGRIALRGLSPVVSSYHLPATGALVGRAAALGDILAALPGGADGEERPASPTPPLILVTAEAGMGKTRLLAEVAKQARAAGILTLAGGCYEQEGRLPYGPIHDALLDYGRSQSEAVLKDQLHGLLDGLGRIVPGLGVRSGDTEHGPPRDAESERTRLFSAVSQALVRISRDCPIVLLLDDLQWADEATVHLLHYISRQTQRGRLLTVAACRAEELSTDTPLTQIVADAEAGGQGRIVTLTPLTQVELATVLEERLGDRCSPAFVRELHERSAGNPFFALQILRLLKESGHLKCTRDGWEAEHAAPRELPPAVRQTIMRRLRRLGADEREALTLGAVLGREFAYAPLEAMWEEGERSLFASLDATVDAHLLQETERGYAFSHPLLWEVVYWRVPAGRRALLHERAGLKLEEFYGDAVASHAAELAHHFLSAGRVHLDREVRYLTLTGDAALHAYAWTEALLAYSQALELSHEQNITAELQEKRGEVLKTLARYDDALAALEEAARLYRDLDDMEGEGRVTALVALVHHFRCSWGEGALRVSPVVKRLEQRGASPRTRALLYAALPRVYSLSGQTHKGLEAAERAVALAHQVDDARLLADAVFVRGRALIELDRLDEAVAAFEEARRLAEVVGNLFIQTATLSFVGQACMRRGDLLQTRAYCERYLEMAERRGGLEHLEDALLGLADVHLLLGSWEQARGYVERGLDLPGIRSPRWTAATPTLLGTVSLCQGDWRRVLETVTECHSEAERANAPREYRRATALLAEMNLLTGKPDEALAQVEPFVGDPAAESDARFLLPLAWTYVETGDLTAAGEALARAETAAVKRRTYVPDLLRIKGMLFARHRRWDEAEDAFGQAVREAHPMPNPYAEARALYEWGRMLAQEAELERARSRLEGAFAIFQQLGARPYIERTCAELRPLSTAR